MRVKDEVFILYAVTNTTLYYILCKKPVTLLHVEDHQIRHYLHQLKLKRNSQVFFVQTLR